MAGHVPLSGGVSRHRAGQLDVTQKRFTREVKKRDRSLDLEKEVWRPTAAQLSLPPPGTSYSIEFETVDLRRLKPPDTFQTPGVNQTRAVP